MKGKQNLHDNIHEHSKLSKIPNEEAAKKKRKEERKIFF